MKEEFVSYSQAQLLKECGFDWKCDHYYEGQKGFGLIESSIFSQTFDVSDYWHNFNAYDPNRHCQLGNPAYSAPTLALAQKWLREVKGIDVLVWVCACGYGWNISKAGDELTRGTTLHEYDDKGEDDDSGMWLTYEAALAAGITQALELIKQK